MERKLKTKFNQLKIIWKYMIFRKTETMIFGLKTVDFWFRKY